MSKIHENKHNKLQKLLEIDNRFKKDLVQSDMSKDEGVVTPQKGVILKISGTIKKGEPVRCAATTYSKFSRS